MDTSTYLTLRADFEKCINKDSLFDALNTLKFLVPIVTRRSKHEECEKISSDYQQLLHAFRQGAIDANYQEQTEAIFLRIYQLGQTFHHKFTTLKTQQYRSKLWNKYADDAPLEEALLTANDDKVIFERLYCAAPWSEETEKVVEASMPEGDAADACARIATIYSAVTLNLLSSFDPVQCAWFLRQTKKTLLPLLRVRLCVGLVYVGVHHSAQINLFPHLVRLWKEWVRSAAWKKDLCIVQSTLLATGKSAKSMALSMKELFSSDANMSTAQMINDLKQKVSSAFSERLLGGLAGVDLGFEDFKRLYRRTEQFNEAFRWFVPILIDAQPDAPSEEARNPFFGFGKHSLGITDLYLQKEAEAARKQLLENMRDDLDQIIGDKEGAMPNEVSMPEGEATVLSLEISKENLGIFQQMEQQQGDDTNPISPESFNWEARALRVRYIAYIHDTYRFFHLFVERSEGENPYRDNLMLLDNELFRGAFQEEKVLVLLAQFIFAIKDYAHALDFFQQLPQEHRDVRLRLGQCYHATQQYDEAVKYLEPIATEEEDEALLRLLANCYDALQRPEDALVLWIRLEQMLPNDLELAENLAKRFLDLQLYSDALDQLHKILYHEPEHFEALQLKAQCYLMMSRLEEAQKLYASLLEKHPESSDILFFSAHCALLLGDHSMATRLYMACFEQEHVSCVPENLFDDAVQELQHVGFTPLLARLMRDLLICEMQL